jgi:hypothetical protein
LGIIFSFHSWQATRERKKPVPSPQPKGINKTILQLRIRFARQRFNPTLETNISQHH